MPDPLVSPTVLAVVGLVVLALVTVLSVITRYKVAKPNEAFIITGRKGKTSVDLSGQKVVTGGGVFVLPFVQQLQVLDLSSRRISVTIRGAVSKQGVKLNLDGVAIVKVGGDENSIRAAAQRFLSQQQEITTFTTEVLAGALRSIVGTLTVEEIIRDRASFAAQVAEVTESALTGQGLIMDTFQIQDVTDDGTYLADLGRPEAARVQQEAAIAEAEARRTSEQRRLAAEQEVLDSQRSFALRQAEIKAETDAAAARAAAAGPLAQADQDQAILAEQEKVAVRQAALTERKLDTEVRKPADAERYRVEQEAEARRNAEVLEADARRQATIAAAQ
ncbi:MAG: SPFH domain-containing protein, partial [Actinomycetota bacterium]